MKDGGGEERKKTRVFSELQSHYLSEDKFGRPGMVAFPKWKGESQNGTPLGTGCFVSPSYC